MSLAGWLFSFLVFAHQAEAVPILSVDFEAPEFAVGAVGNGPATAGQGGWGGYPPASISNAQAHSGTQSLLTTYIGDSFYLLKSLNPSQYEFPDAAIDPFNINTSTDWWIQAWVRVNSGGVSITGSNVLGACPTLTIPANGIPFPHSCATFDAGQPTLESDHFNKWLLIQIVHSAAAPPNLVFSITGPSIDRQITIEGYSGPQGSGVLDYLGLRGDAYWDDVSAGYGSVPVDDTDPTQVPEPGSVMLLGAGLLSLALVRRRKPKA